MVKTLPSCMASLACFFLLLVSSFCSGGCSGGSGVCVCVCVYVCVCVCVHLYII